MNPSIRTTSPAAGYLALLALYGCAVGGGTWWVNRHGIRRGGQRTPYDPALIGCATFKISRILARDRVTSVIRLPFVERDPSAPGERAEKPSGRGLRHAVGELLTCPFCVAVWVATGLTFTRAVWPRSFRLVATIFSAVAVADFLQVAYVRLRKAERDAKREASTEAMLEQATETCIDDAISESFPASDPPFWTGTHAGGPMRF